MPDSTKTVRAKLRRSILNSRTSFSDMLKYQWYTAKRWNHQSQRNLQTRHHYARLQLEFEQLKAAGSCIRGLEMGWGWVEWVRVPCANQPARPGGSVKAMRLLRNRSRLSSACTSGAEHSYNHSYCLIKSINIDCVTRNIC